jgi:hypothetical protein
MKKFKISIFSILMVLAVFTSCTNEEVIVDPQQDTEESESIITTLSRLNEQFDENGNVDQAENPAGNVVFDFCFDFVYPINLSFNTGTTVTANNLDEVIEIYNASTENLYVNGIAFPFQVETYNENSNTLEIETINNEDEFLSLLEDCGFEDEVDDCFCTEEYDPVCIDITDLDGELFTISYPNACYAICDGFTEDDFSEECQQDYDSGANECFEFVYPISIILDEGEPVSVNSREELFNATYGAYHIDLVLPLDIIIEGGTVVTINDYYELENIIEGCFGDDDFVVVDCSIEDIASALINCFWQIDFVDDDQYLYNFFNNGTYQVQSDDSLLTSGEWIINDGNETFYITLAANSPNYNDEWVVTVCDESLEMQSLVSPQAELYSIDCIEVGLEDCSIEDVAVLLSECLWQNSDNDNYTYNINLDYTFEVVSENTIITTGTWDLGVTNNGYIMNLYADDSQFQDTWLIADCYEGDLFILSLIYEATIFSENCD